MTAPKLRVAVMLDSLTVPAWIYRLLAELSNSDHVNLALIILNGSDADESEDVAGSSTRTGGAKLLQRLLHGMLRQAYKALMKQTQQLPDAMAPMDCSALLTGVPSLTAAPRQTRFSDYLTETDVAAIRTRDIDVIVRCGYRILRGGVLRAARYGIWSLHHGDNRENRGGLAGFWESMEGWPVTGSVLQILSDDLDNGKVLYRSWSCTDGTSVADNRNNYYWKSLFFIPRKLKELHELGEEAFFAKVNAENRTPEFYSKRLYTPPSNGQLARLLTKKFVQRQSRRIAHRLWFDQWVLMFDLREEFSSSLWRYRSILPPKDRFWADPLVVHQDGTYYVFIEEYLYGTRKGHVSVMTMDAEGHYSVPRKVLERPYHLSYPFVFEFENQYFMVPETADNRTIELYRCTRFPDEWEWHCNLMEDVFAADVTLLFRDDRWWLFANMAEHEGVSIWDELYLFSTSDLFSGHWIPHPRNPVVSDCRSARPAGRLFSMNGSLYRPSQNCSRRYGYGLNFAEVTALTESDYAEVVVSRARPEWNRRATGLHTFSRAGNLHFIDALYRRSRF